MLTGSTGTAELRAAFRGGLSRPTAGLAPGRVQANLIAVPRDRAFDMLLFAQRNPHACPVLDVSEPGTATTVLAPGADLRTDLPLYRVWRNGTLDRETTDVSADWTDDLVAFLIGCSFTFEAGLQAAGIEVRHVASGCNVPMFLTIRTRRPGARLPETEEENVTTYRAALALTGTTVPDHLLAGAEVPVLVGPQAQGDLMVFRGAAPTDLEWRPLPVTGLRLVDGEATGNTHWLHAGFGSPDVQWAVSTFGPSPRLGFLRVPPGQSALLIHTDEHGANGIGPGTHVVHRKRELAPPTEESVEQTRLVAD